MELKIVEFFAAKMLKNHGFQEECNYAYKTNNTLISDKKKNHNKETNKFSAPTQALVCKWLREKHNIFLSITFEMDTWELYINNGINKTSFSPEETTYSSYEEAERIGIQQGIKLLNLRNQKL